MRTKSWVLGFILPVVAASQTEAQSASKPGDTQQMFDSAKAAVDVLLQACKDNDTEALVRLFGPRLKAAVEKIDDAEERIHRHRFWEQSQEAIKLEEQSPEKVFIVVGKEMSQLPIPLVKEARGWRFDTDEGFEELAARRIGENELAAIAVGREYLSAQREYAAYDHDGDGVLEYAQRLRSSPGMHDGLYWPTSEGSQEPLSPFGPLLAQADISMKEIESQGGFMGYRFKVLTRQGGNVPGGSYDYVINGNLIAGFALLAWPEDYRSSGVMSFLVSHHGRIYQKDLGPQTASIAEAMEVLNPDESWKVVVE